MADGRSIHQHGTSARRWPAYVRLDGYAGVTKLFGVVVGETRRYYEFVPDRNHYRFRKGVKKRVLKQHVRPQYVEIESAAHRDTAYPGGCVGECASMAVAKRKGRK